MLGPPLVELDCCDVLQKVHASLTGKDLTHEHKVKAKGRRGSVLLDIVKARDVGAPENGID